VFLGSTAVSVSDEDILWLRIELTQASIECFAQFACCDGGDEVGVTAVEFAGAAKVIAVMYEQVNTNLEAKLCREEAWYLCGWALFRLQKFVAVKVDIWKDVLKSRQAVTQSFRARLQAFEMVLHALVVDGQDSLRESKATLVESKQLTAYLLRVCRGKLSWPSAAIHKLGIRMLRIIRLLLFNAAPAITEKLGLKGATLMNREAATKKTLLDECLSCEFISLVIRGAGYAPTPAVAAALLDSAAWSFEYVALKLLRAKMAQFRRVRENEQKTPGIRGAAAGSRPDLKNKVEMAVAKSDKDACDLSDLFDSADGDMPDD
jgi:hypothetical protein